MTEQENPTTENPFLAPTETNHASSVASQNKTSKSFIALALANGLGVFASGYALAVVIPSFRNMFEEFGIELPAITLFVFRWSQLWPVIIFLFSFASIASLVIHWLLRRKKRGLAITWFYLVIAVWALWFVLLILSLLMPMLAIP